MSTSEEVSLELLLLDGSNYTSWSASVLVVFRTMGQIIHLGLLVCLMFLGPWVLK